MNFETIKAEHTDFVAAITLNLPEKLNSLSSKMMEEMIRACDEIEGGGGSSHG